MSPLAFFCQRKHFEFLKAGRTNRNIYCLNFMRLKDYFAWFLTSRKLLSYVGHFISTNLVLFFFLNHIFGTLVYDLYLPGCLNVSKK